jgi:hypothetical protein
LGDLTGLLPGGHWTYALVLLYGVVAVVLFLVRRRLINQQSGWRTPSPTDDEFRCGIRARFGVAGSILLGLALICMFIGADQDNQLTGKIMDDASFFLLTTGFIEMAIYPWSPATLEIGSDLRPYLYNASRRRITGEWAGQPVIQVLTLDHIRVQGKRISRKDGSQPEEQHLDLYRNHLGDRAFEQLMVFIERNAHVHLPVRD